MNALSPIRAPRRLGGTEGMRIPSTQARGPYTMTHFFSDGFVASGSGRTHSHVH